MMVTGCKEGIEWCFNLIWGGSTLFMVVSMLFKNVLMEFLVVFKEVLMEY